MRALINVLLAVLCAVLVLGIVNVTQDHEARARPAGMVGVNAELAAVDAAARDQAAAFLTVDHTRMPEITATVLRGATGAFAEQYAAQAGGLQKSAVANQAVAQPTVLDVGVQSLQSDRAVALVAADTRVRNLATKGAEQPRVYRLRLVLQRVDDRWLTSELGYVG